MPTSCHKHENDRSNGEVKRRHRRSGKDRGRLRDKHHRDKKKSRRSDAYSNIPKNIQLQGVHRSSIHNEGGKHPDEFGMVANSLSSFVSEFSSAIHRTVDESGAKGDRRDQILCCDSHRFQKPSTSFVPSQGDAKCTAPRLDGTKRKAKGDEIQTYLSKAKSTETQEKEGGKATVWKCKSDEKSKPAHPNNVSIENNVEGNGSINHAAVEGNTGKAEGVMAAEEESEEEIAGLDAVSLRSDLSDEIVTSSIVTSKPLPVNGADTIPLSIGSYIDRSQEPDTLPNTHITTPNRCASFVVKLYAVLSYHPELSHVITWLPHGRFWTILDPAEFEVDVIPKHFGSGVSLVSFTKRITNVWGFERLSMDGNNNHADGVSNNDAAVPSFSSLPSKKNAKNNLLHKSYCHEYFLRGKPHLLKKMVPIADTKKTTINITTSKNLTETDLETLGRKVPLPANSDDADDEDESVIVMKMIDGFIMEHGPTTRLPVSLCHRRSLGRGRAKSKEQSCSSGGGSKGKVVAQARTASPTSGNSTDGNNKADKNDNSATGKRALPADFGMGDRPVKINKTGGASYLSTVRDEKESSSAASAGHNSNQVTATQTLTEMLQAFAKNHPNISSLFLNQNGMNFNNIVAAMNNSSSNVANATTVKPAAGCVSNDCVAESIVTAPAGCPNTLQSMMNSSNVQLQLTKMKSDSSLVSEYQKRPPKQQLTQNGCNIEAGNKVTCCQPAMHAAVMSINGKGCDGNSHSVVKNPAPACNQIPFLQVQQDQLQRSSQNTMFTNCLQDQQINLTGIANNCLLQTQAVPPAATLPNYGNVAQIDFPQPQMIFFPGFAVPQSVTNNQSPQQNGAENATSMVNLLHMLQANQRVLLNNSSQSSTNGNDFGFSLAGSNDLDQSQIPRGLSNNHQDTQQNPSMNSANIMNWLQQMHSTAQNFQNTESSHGVFQNNISVPSPPTILPKMVSSKQTNQTMIEKKAVRKPSEI